MKKQKKQKLCTALGSLAAFTLWTAVIRLVDVQAIGPQGSAVGLATLNGLFHDLTGVHWSLYLITDWLSLVPVGMVLGFGVLGLTQWVKRKSLLKVDRSILVLGGFYLVVLAVYGFFEVYAVNYRPVLIEGVLEVSYPSSTTMLVMTVMPTAALQLKSRLHDPALRRGIVFAIIAFTAFMVVSRLVSGVHWVTDIIGGGLLSAGLVMLYDSLAT